MKVKLEEVILSLEETSRELGFYYNPKDGKIFASNIGDYSNLDTDSLDELFLNSIMLPTKYDINEYGMLIDFIKTFKDDNLSIRLSSAINGKGAFRRFKDVCIEHGIINDWYKFKDEKYKEIAIAWCKSNGIEIIE